MRHRSRLLMVSVFLALAGLSGLAYILGLRSPREELFSVTELSRPVEARLSGMHFAPYRSKVEFPFRSPRFRQAVKRVVSAARRDARPHELGDLAVVELFSGRSDEAVATLERALAAAPKDKLLLSDLAGAYIARAGSGDRSFDIVRALSSADYALRIDRSFREALFNRALALEKLGLPAAKRAWVDIVAVEDDAGWRNEAEAHLLRLQTR